MSEELRSARRHPDLRLLQDRLQECRRAMLTHAAPLTLGLLEQTLGCAETRLLLEDFWSCQPPCPGALDEGSAFLDYLGLLPPLAPYQEEVACYERAALDAVATGKPQVAVFQHHPLQLLGAVAAGNLPAAVPAGVFQLVLTPEDPA